MEKNMKKDFELSILNIFKDIRVCKEIYGLQ